jgi:predicted dehydrogenase
VTQTATPKNKKSIRWGIIGAGSISRDFAQGLATLPDAELVAVASRSEDSAKTFAADIGQPLKTYGSYQAIADDPEIDAVYIGTLHSSHKANAMTCLEAGKAVLCEKPFTINAKEAEEVIRVARTKKVFLMEAMWTRFFPLMDKLRELLAENAIGDLQMLHADFGYRTNIKPSKWPFQLEHGGGSLLDVGIYPLSLASHLLGQPARMTGLARLGATGIDENAAMVLGYDTGALAVLSSSFNTETPQHAILLGSSGRIHIHTPWWKPSSLTLTRSGQAPETIERPFESNGYQFEAAEVIRCLREGQLESDLMPLDETLSIMQTMDELRAQWGLRYPVD